MSKVLGEDNNQFGVKTPPQRAPRLPPLKISSRTQSLLCLDENYVPNGGEGMGASSVSPPNSKMVLKGRYSLGLGQMSARSFTEGMTSYRMEEDSGYEDELIKGGLPGSHGYLTARSSAVPSKGRRTSHQELKEEDEFAFVAAVRRNNSCHSFSAPRAIRPFSSRHKNIVKVASCPTGPSTAFCGSPVTGCQCHVIPATCATGPKGAFCGSPITGCKCHELKR